MYRFSQIIFWFAFIVLTYLFLMPQQYLAPEVFDWSDKLQHSLALFVLTILGLLAYGVRQKQMGRVILALAIYGALIEILQSLSGWRYGEFRDYLADLLGVMIAWSIIVYTQKHAFTSKFFKTRWF